MRMYTYISASIEILYEDTCSEYFKIQILFFYKFSYKKVNKVISLY